MLKDQTQKKTRTLLAPELSYVFSTECLAQFACASVPPRFCADTGCLALPWCQLGKRFFCHSNRYHRCFLTLVVQCLHEAFRTHVICVHTPETWRSKESEEKPNETTVGTELSTACERTECRHAMPKPCTTTIMDMSIYAKLG